MTEAPSPRTAIWADASFRDSSFAWAAFWRVSASAVLEAITCGAKG